MSKQDDIQICKNLDEAISVLKARIQLRSTRISSQYEMLGKLLDFCFWLDKIEVTGNFPEVRVKWPR